MAGSGTRRGWVVTLAGTGINLALGVLYTWSVLKKAIPPEWGWDDADKALPYSLACIVFALMMVPAGRLQDKIGPRWVATAGGILTGLGCVIASYATTVLWYVIGFGLLAGAGIGLGYASATPPAVKWFPARKTGLIAGVVVAGFGLASAYISPVANYLTGNDIAGKPRGELAEALAAAKGAEQELKVAREAPAAGTGEEGERSVLEREVGAKEDAAEAAGARLVGLREANIHRTLLYLGIGFVVIVVLLAQLLRVPPPGYKPEEAGGKAAASAATPAPDLGPAALLRSPLFYLLWLMFACGAGAGLMIIANITTIAKIGAIEAGFVLVALLAVGNALGRVIAGMLSDEFGRTWTMFGIFLLQAVMMLVLRTGLADIVAFVAASMLIGFNYGACLSVFPSATKDCFGLRNFGVNYGLVFTSWGVGGFVFPLVAGKLFEASKAAGSPLGSYDDAYLVAAGALAFAALLTFVARRVEQEHRQSVAAGPSHAAPQLPDERAGAVAAEVGPARGAQVAHAHAEGAGTTAQDRCS